MTPARHCSIRGWWSASRLTNRLMALSLGDLPVEPASLPELAAAAQPFQQLVVVANLEEKLDQVGPPHGLGGVAGPSGTAVVLEDIEEGLVVEAIEDSS